MPCVVPCPAHKVHGPAEYSWGMYRDGTFLAIKDSIHHGKRAPRCDGSRGGALGARVPPLVTKNINLI